MGNRGWQLDGNTDRMDKSWRIQDMKDVEADMLEL